MWNLLFSAFNGRKREEKKSKFLFSRQPDFDITLRIRSSCACEQSAPWILSTRFKFIVCKLIHFSGEGTNRHRPRSCTLSSRWSGPACSEVRCLFSLKHADTGVENIVGLRRSSWQRQLPERKQSLSQWDRNWQTISVEIGGLQFPF